jgi:hypothetical protein
MKPVSEIQPEQDLRGRYSPPKEVEAMPLKKPTRAFCGKELSRLNGKFGAPRGHEDEYRLKLVLDAMQRVAESEAHVTAIVDRLEVVENFPTGYDISQAGLATRTREKRPRRDCPKCFGNGFYVLPEEDGQGKAGPCDCWRPVVITA